MFNKKNNYFYDSFKELMVFPVEEMSILSKGLADFNNDKLDQLKNDVHMIEHKADLRKKEIEERLAKEFITPIDREDIFVLLDNIDDLSDAIDEISYKLYIRNYKVLPKDIDIFIKKSIDAVDAIREVINNFEHINDKAIMDPLINKVLEIEEEVDKLYEMYVHKLYVESSDYDQNRLSERVYSYFEYVTDKCRDISKTVLIIMYKNL